MSYRDREDFISLVERIYKRSNKSCGFSGFRLSRGTAKKGKSLIRDQGHNRWGKTHQRSRTLDDTGSCCLVS